MSFAVKSGVAGHSLFTPTPGMRNVEDTWIEELARELVGSVRIDVAQDYLKLAMLNEALERTAGNLSGAARLLGVTRQAIQQMLARYGMRRPSSIRTL